MPRRKLSEYRAKVLVSEGLNLPYVGWSVQSTDDLQVVKGSKSYVLKVDQAEKGRFKKGLVLLDLSKKELTDGVKQLQEKGYEHFIVEPYSLHEQSDERYISLGYDKHHYYLSYSIMGGVDIEQNPDSVTTVLIGETTDWGVLAKETGFSEEQLRHLFELFRRLHFTFLEINPYTVSNDGQIHLMDAAVEVDDAGTFFVSEWGGGDIRNPVAAKKTLSEEVVAGLDEKSPASFNLSVLNPHGSIFLLLSGGGASVVVADEIHNHGLGGEIANYGEYSGNPTEHETYVYTSALIELLLASNAKKKVLFIGGAVANFTDIANTFAGIIRAVDEHADNLRAQQLKVFVRRGGPRQEIGLRRIRDALEKYEILGDVYDPNTSIHDAVRAVITEVKA
ncbi:MAG: ATP citrate lyase citrate-binding domain-containing protein [Candidatus Saccharimonadales bacterium]